MSYMLLRGEFVIRYADLPRNGPEPDGDTVKFDPDTPSLVELLPHRSGRGPDINARGISVRLEAIDALETHFSETHQELRGGEAARNELLRLLGFTGVRFWHNQPNKVEAADQDRIRGHVLSNGIDANGRMIGFVYPGDPADPDGSAVFVDEALVDNSVNAHLLAQGHAYPAFYATLPATLRDHLAGVAKTSRTAQPPLGLWPTSTADPNGAADASSLARLEKLVMWPKLFRRIVPYLAAGYTDFDGFDAWLRADPTNRDDELFLLDRLERGNMHDVVHCAGAKIQLTSWPENFIISPDPAPGGHSGGSRPSALGDVVIVAALPDPSGADAGAESVTVLNTTAAPLDLTGWGIADAAGSRQALTGTIAAGATIGVVMGTVQLGNSGDSLVLLDANGAVIDRVAYKASQVRPGRTICFGR